MKNKKIRNSLIFVILFTVLMALASYGLYDLLSDTYLLSRFKTDVLMTHKQKSRIPTKSIKRILAGLTQSYRASEIEDFAILCTTAAEEKPVYKAQALQKEIKVAADQGDEFEVTIYIKNTGNIPWFSDKAPCGRNVYRTRLGTAKPKDRESIFASVFGWIQSNRIEMAEKRVDPGEIATFNFISFAPLETDIYREYFAPVIEGKTWIEDKEALVQIDIAVGDITEEDEEKLKFINKSLPASTITDLSAPLKVHIDLSDQKMFIDKGDVTVREYTVSTGARRTPTPRGSFKILNKQDLRIGKARPHYRMPYWQGVTKGGVGLHSLPYLANDKGVFWKEALNHIGQPVSHGCIRLLPEDAEDLFAITQLGDPVIIHS